MIAPSTNSVRTVEWHTVVSIMFRNGVGTNCFTKRTLFPAATERLREKFLNVRNHVIYGLT